MVRRKYFQHSRIPGGPTLATRLRRVAYRGLPYAENIAYDSDADATRIVAAWMGSPGHRSNILHPRLRYAGVGVAMRIPDTPPGLGSTYTMDYGGTLD